MKPLHVLLLAAVLAVAAAGCGGSGDSAMPGPNEVVMSEYRFDPREPVVSHGTQLTVRNAGEIAHDLTLEQIGSGQRLIGTDTFISGDSGKLRVDLPPGRYKMVCTVPGHEQRGMVGTLRVR